MADTLEDGEDEADVDVDEDEDEFEEGSSPASDMVLEEFASESESESSIK